MGMMDFQINEDVYDRVAEGRRAGRKRRYVEQGVQSIPAVLAMVQGQMDRYKDAELAEQLASRHNLPKEYGEIYRRNPPGMLSALTAQHARGADMRREDQQRVENFQAERGLQHMKGQQGLARANVMAAGRGAGGISDTSRMSNVRNRLQELESQKYWTLKDGEEWTQEQEAELLWHQRDYHRLLKGSGGEGEITDPPDEWDTLMQQMYAEETGGQ